MPLIDCNPLDYDDPATAGCLNISVFAQLLVGIFEYLLLFSTFIAVLFIVWGGFQMVKGWFEEDPQGSYKDGMTTVRRAIFGFVLILGAFLIVETLLAIFGVQGGVNRFLKDAFG